MHNIPRVAAPFTPNFIPNGEHTKPRLRLLIPPGRIALRPLADATLNRTAKNYLSMLWANADIESVTNAARVVLVEGEILVRQREPGRVRPIRPDARPASPARHRPKLVLESRWIVTREH